METNKRFINFITVFMVTVIFFFACTLPEMQQADDWTQDELMWQAAYELELEILADEEEIPAMDSRSVFTNQESYNRTGYWATLSAEKQLVRRYATRLNGNNAPTG